MYKWTNIGECLVLSLSRIRRVIQIRRDFWSELDS